MAFQDSQSSVGGPSVNNNVFDRGEILVAYALDGPLDRAGGIEAYGDDADEWWGTVHSSVFCDRARA
jgi:hypothetical protein